MKQVVFLFSLLLVSIFGFAQNTDSILAEPQTIELSISTPQPRINETFQISLDINHLKANIFKSLIGKVELSDDRSYTDNGLLTIKVKALKKGTNEAGPLMFTLDNTKYTTNKITYEVVDSLPDTDVGLWFRKVNTSDSTFCIIIEQRIPAVEKTIKQADNSISYTTEPEYSEIVKFKSSYSIDGLSNPDSNSSTNFSSIEVNGVEKQFMYAYSVYYFSIDDKKAGIKITKDILENIPKGYKFNDIIVQ